MKTLTAEYLKELFWVKPRPLQRHYELRSRSDLFAVLQWYGFRGTLACGESSFGKWVFERTGLFRPRVTVSPLLDGHTEVVPSASAPIPEIMEPEATNQDGAPAAGSKEVASAESHELATFMPRWIGDGLLVTDSGKRYRWVLESFWNSQWAWTTDHDSLVMSFRPAQRSFVFEGATVVTVTPEVAVDAELTLLLTLGYYLMVLTYDVRAEDGGY